MKKTLGLIAGLILASQAHAIDGIATMNQVTRTSYTVTTYTATVISLSTTANLGGFPLTIMFSTRGGGTGIYWQTGYSATLTTVTATVDQMGHYTAASATATILDKLDPNMVLALLGTGSASSTVWLNIFAERK